VKKQRLKFVSYKSSEWEQLWLDNLDEWIKPDQDTKKLRDSNACRQLLIKQANFSHDFLNLTCATRFPLPYHEWCRFDGFLEPLYYRTSERSRFDISPTPPEGLLEFESEQYPRIRPEPILPTERDEHIVSKFIFRDTETGEELVEYIEPLISHLRFPLAGCLPRLSSPNGYKGDGFMLTKSYIVPPSPAIRSTRRRTSDALTTNPYHDKYLYFDAGASSWTKGAGGPSLEYFTNMWPRHGIVFDEIYAFEATTPADKFYQTVPNLFWSDRTMYQKAYVSSRLEDDTSSTPFIPRFIQDHATIQDYVIFKLDIDSPGVEEASIDYLLQQNNSNAHLWIDELFWEHHIYDNPFMRHYWYPSGNRRINQTDPTMRGSYNKFLRLRQLGIRAHSWV
jgi:hypothetical protein